jgi:hypothetical protein
MTNTTQEELQRYLSDNAAKRLADCTIEEIEAYRAASRALAKLFGGVK